MISFAQKIARGSNATIYHIEETGEGDIDMFTILLAVAPHKRDAFERVIKSDEKIRAEDYGRVVYYGAGMLSKRSIDEILSQDS